MLGYEQKRKLAVWLARAWTLFAPLLIFAACYLAFYLLIPALGFEKTRLYPAIGAGIAVLLNWPELGGDLVRAFRYRVSQK